jgi:O-antigen ligase
MKVSKLPVLYWLIVLAVFTIPISQFLSVRILFCICLFSFFIKETNGGSLRFLKNAWDIVLYLSVLVFGLAYSEDINTGLKVMETSFALFAFPFIFRNVDHFQRDRFNTILLSFATGLVLASLICLAAAGFSFYQHRDIGVFFFYQLAQQIDLQPTYLAYYLCFATTLVLYFFYYEVIKMPQWIFAVVVFFLFSMLMLTAGRTAYISMLLTFSFFILKFLFEVKSSSNQKIIFLFSIVLLTAMLVVNHFDLNIGYRAVVGNNDYWERLVLWKAALDANPDFLFGVGTGDYKVVLNAYFLRHGLYQYAESSYNSHNQFIQSLFSNGLIGLASLLLLLVRPLYLSVTHQNILGILVFFPFLIYGITEVFLGRYQGVVFFAFLHQCFISHYFAKTTISGKN